MTEFFGETLLLLPFLFATYLVLETVEAHAGGALGRLLERARCIGPLAGALAGAIPQCGVSAAAASFYAGGAVTVGTLLSVFLSTSDELLLVLFSARAPLPLLLKIAGIKIVCAIAVGFTAGAVLSFMRHVRRDVSIGELCEQSRCGCSEHGGIVKPALVHTVKIFLFIAAISGAIELCMHFFGEESLLKLRLTEPFVGELAAGALGLIPNCAVSVASAELYMAGAMSPSALMASSFTGSGLGLLVLFRTNRNMTENLTVLASLYVVGVLLGLITGPLL